MSRPLYRVPCVMRTETYQKIEMDTMIMVSFASNTVNR